MQNRNVEMAVLLTMNLPIVFPDIRRYKRTSTNQCAYVRSCHGQPHHNCQRSNRFQPDYTGWSQGIECSSLLPYRSVIIDTTLVILFWNNCIYKLSFYMCTNEKILCLQIHTVNALGRSHQYSLNTFGKTDLQTVTGNCEETLSIKSGDMIKSIVLLQAPPQSKQFHRHPRYPRHQQVPS